MRRRSVTLVLCFFIALAPVVSFAQLADDKCKFLGNIIAGSVPSDFRNYWNQITPENAGKWESVEFTRDAMSWAGLDVAYNAAKNNDLPFKQHTFVWGQQQPGWIGELTLEEQKAEVEEWIQQFCERYPETDFIDVVNEPLHAPPAYAQALGGSGSTGWEWVIWSFEKAREYCPNAKLILNDYNIVSNDAATSTYIQIINLLKDRELIDIVGEQGHFLETTPINTIKGNLTRLQATGLPIHISEFDVNIASDAGQQDEYEELFPVLWEHPGVHGITLWGYKQGQIWREDAYLVRSNGTKRPALTWLETYVENNSGGTFCLPVSIEDQLEDGFEVYPNPSSGNFTVRMAGNYDVRVMDMQGRERSAVLVRNENTVSIQMDEPAGMYVVRISDGWGEMFRKIVVK